MISNIFKSGPDPLEELLQNSDTSTLQILEHKSVLESFYSNKFNISEHFQKNDVFKELINILATANEEKKNLFNTVYSLFSNFRNKRLRLKLLTEPDSLSDISEVFSYNEKKELKRMELISELFMIDKDYESDKDDKILRAISNSSTFHLNLLTNLSCKSNYYLVLYLAKIQKDRGFMPIIYKIFDKPKIEDPNQLSSISKIILSVYDKSKRRELKKYFNFDNYFDFDDSTIKLICILADDGHSFLSRIFPIFNHDEFNQINFWVCILEKLKTIDDSSKIYNRFVECMLYSLFLSCKPPPIPIISASIEAFKGNFLKPIIQSYIPKLIGKNYETFKKNIEKSINMRVYLNETVKIAYGQETKLDDVIEKYKNYEYEDDYEYDYQYEEDYEYDAQI